MYANKITKVTYEFTLKKKISGISLLQKRDSCCFQLCTKKIKDTNPSNIRGDTS